MNTLLESLQSELTYHPDASYQPGTILPFVSYKNPEKEPEERGRAVLTVGKDFFHVSAVLEDTDIFNTAHENNEKTWMTGDVLEFFIQCIGHKDYFEFHVTPNEITLQLHLPSVEQLTLVPFEEKTRTLGMTGKAGIDTKNNRWTGEITVPFSAIGATRDQINGIRFAICRYNYNQKSKEPEISSTRFFPKGGFHCPPEWHIIQGV